MTRPISLSWAALLTTSIIISIPTTARAEDVTAEEFRGLIDAAADEGSISELRGVTSVDGQTVDLGPILTGDAEDIARRLDALDIGEVTRTRDPAAARAAAQSILAGDRFGEPDHPRPFAGLLDRITGWLRGPWESLLERFNTLSGWGKAAVLAIAAAILLSAGWALARLLAKRRPGPSDPQTLQTTSLRVEGPEELERAAEAAEDERDYGLAVRLRFRAGLLRLADGGVIDFRPSDTSLSLRRKVHSPVFDNLADRFDAIVYGRQHATPEDAEEARLKWRSLHREIRV